MLFHIIKVVRNRWRRHEEELVAYLSVSNLWSGWIPSLLTFCGDTLFCLPFSEQLNFIHGKFIYTGDWFLHTDHWQTKKIHILFGNDDKDFTVFFPNKELLDFQGILAMLSAILGQQFFMECYYPLGEVGSLHIKVWYINIYILKHNKSISRNFVWMISAYQSGTFVQICPV